MLFALLSVLFFQKYMFLLDYSKYTFFVRSVPFAESLTSGVRAIPRLMTKPSWLIL
jgi:hypothetical protein